MRLLALPAELYPHIWERHKISIFNFGEGCWYTLVPGSQLSYTPI